MGTHLAAALCRIVPVELGMGVSARAVWGKAVWGKVVWGEEARGPCIWGGFRRRRPSCSPICDRKGIRKDMEACCSLGL